MAHDLFLALALGWGGAQGPQVLIVHSRQAFPAPSVPNPCCRGKRKKRDSQLIIDSLRDTLDERNATVESLQGLGQG